MKTKRIAFLIAVVVVTGAHSSPSQAKTDVPAKIEQLRENAANSKVNLKQYEENLKIVDANLQENARGLKALEKQKQSLDRQKLETAKGKSGVDGVKKQLDGYLMAETQKLEAEKKQIAELQKTLETLMENQKKREANIAEYQQKMTTIETEMAAWSERNQSIVELEQAIRAKEKEALEDRKRFADKKATYEEEIAKWKKQSRVSERQYENFSKLKD